MEVAEEKAQQREEEYKKQVLKPCRTQLLSILYSKLIRHMKNLVLVVL